MINYNFLNSYDKIKINPITRAIGDFDIEVFENAKYIRNKTDKKIMVALSGGIDSEVACISFLKTGIEFEALTMQYTNNRNSYDFYFAKKFCDENNIKQHVITVEPENFYIDIIQKYKNQGVYAHSLHRYLQIYLLDVMDQLGYTGIFAAGEQSFYTFDNEIYVRYAPTHVPVNWLIEKNIKAFPSFYLATPEIQAAYYNDPLIKFLLADPRYFKTHIVLGSSAEKILVYHKFFNLHRRKKMVGYENIIPLKNKLENNLKEYSNNSRYFYKPLTEVVNELGLIWQI